MSSKLKRIATLIIKWGRSSSIEDAILRRQSREVNHNPEHVNIDCITEESVVRSIFCSGNSRVVSLPDHWIVAVTKRDVSKISKENPVHIKLSLLPKPDSILITPMEKPMEEKPVEIQV